MTPLRTELAAQTAPFRLTHHSHILALGSCFAENISAALALRLFHINANPFGIVYNASAIAEQLRRIADVNFRFDESHIALHNELWYSNLHHSQYSGVDKLAVLTQINTQLAAAQTHWQTTNRLLITLGTAQYFVDKTTDSVVANCHKRPAADFDIRRGTVAENVTVLFTVFEELWQQKPDLQIILTVSPVRYQREGLLQNSQSKAALLLATNELTQRFAQCHYFSAFEYLIDDLRDYRFYADDMLHPNKAALDYIWAKFCDTYFDEDTRWLNRRITRLQTARQHRPSHTDTLAYRNFLAKTAEETTDLHREYPFLRPF